ncbi:MAG: hypothetical protein QGF90_16270, partial [Gammaproteobacteria bacterium]|nr:hypothetical protein [Gammaproteobacteria bacterium]
FADLSLDPTDYTWSVVDTSSATLTVSLFVQPLGGIDASAWDFSALSTVDALADQLGSAGLNLVEGSDYQLLVVGQDDNGTTDDTSDDATETITIQLGDLSAPTSSQPVGQIQVQSIDPELDRHQLTFGMANGASPAYDLGLDVLSPPSPQPPVQLYAYWQINDSVAPRLLTDYRSPSDSANYQLVVRADEQPFTLSWDVSSLPTEFTRLQLHSVSDPDQSVIDMRQQAAVTFAAQQQDYVFQLVLAQQSELALEAGWNLISLAGQPLQTDPSSLKGESQTAMLPMFSWNPSGFSYQKVEELKLGEGYWMLSLSQDGESLSLPLKAVDNYSVQLKAGWNLIGSVAQPFDFANATDVPDGAIAAGSLYGWRAK